MPDTICKVLPANIWIVSQIYFFENKISKEKKEGGHISMRQGCGGIVMQVFLRMFWVPGVLWGRVGCGIGQAEFCITMSLPGALRRDESRLVPVLDLKQIPGL